MIPPRAHTLPDLLSELAREQGSAAAFIHRDVAMTWADLDEEATRAAAGLRELGVGPGDRVAFLSANRPEWVVGLFAATRCGGVFVGLNTWFLDNDIEYVLGECGATVAIASSDVFGRDALAAVRRSAERLPRLKSVVALEGPGALGNNFSALLGTSVLGFEPALVRGDDPAQIVFTSGSTGRPKGVVLDHGDLVENGWAIGERMHLTPRDRVWVAIPMFFSFFCANALPAVATHRGSFLLQDGFEPHESIRLMRRHAATVYYGMPHMAEAILEALRTDGGAISSLRTGLTIGPPAAIRRTAELVPGICNIYGLTETYGNCAVTDVAEPLDLRATSQGLPLPGMQVEAIDSATRQPLPAGTSGILRVRGRVTRGYFNDPGATSAVLDTEGWFDTGDLGHVGPDGRVFYEGRAKEVIKAKGINVAPTGIEDVLLGHPHVTAAYVVGVPDEIEGELVTAIVELAVGTRTTAAELRDYCRQRLPRYAVPARFWTCAAQDIPRTASGKPLRSKLVDLILDASDGGPTETAVHPLPDTEREVPRKVQI